MDARAGRGGSLTCTRQQHTATDFISYYETLCAVQSSCPVSSVRAAAKEGVLNCQVYRLSWSDWQPILTAVSANRSSLHTLVFLDKWRERAYTQLTDVSSDHLPLSSRVKQVTGASDNKETTYAIVRAVKECLTVSSVVRSLVLEGVQLRLRDVKCLMKGVNVCRSLRHISFKGSKCGDACTEVLCRGLQQSDSHVEWLDLTYCDLTSTGAASIASLIRHQCLSRRRCAWEKSLRGSHPRHSGMPGLHRVTLNLNPSLGDAGVMNLANALQDDLWIKAVDLQSCSLTNSAVEALLDMLQSNTTLMILDLRANHSLDDSTLASIHEQLTVNMAATSSCEETHQWLDMEVVIIEEELRHTGMATKGHRRRPQQLNKKQSSIPISRSISASEMVMSLPKAKREPGMPWRTAARSMHRWLNLGRSASSSSTVHAVTTSSSWLRKQNRDKKAEQEEEEEEEEDSEDKDDHEQRDSSLPMRVAISRSFPATAGERGSGRMVLTEDQFRELQDEIVTCHCKLREEKSLVLQLEAENKELKKKVASLEAKLAHNTTVVSEIDSHRDLNAQTLTAIEAAFQQFHALLDLLNEKGSSVPQMC